jgi:uncharacterized membrane protein HdeD (DUF308 family)
MTTVGADTYGIVPEDEFNEFVAGPGFWVLLIMGILWVLLSFLLLQFTYASITALSVLVGIVLLVAAASEIAWAFVAEGWKWLHGALGVLFVLGSIFAFVYPGQTFGTLALIFGWYLLIKGTFDIIMAFNFHGYPLWWVGLIAGVIEIAFAFWAVGYVGRSAALLLIWVGIGALMRGITSIVAAFQLRHAAREVRV